MANLKISTDLEAEIAAIAAGAGCELLRLSFQRNVLQILLDNPNGGVTLEHCQTVSKQVSALLDLSDLGDGRYVLEVSSPGLDRELFRPQDYQRFQGSLARVTYFDGGERKGKKTVIGRISAYDPETETIALTEEGQPTRTIPLRDVGKARLEIEL